MHFSSISLYPIHFELGIMFLIANSKAQTHENDEKYFNPPIVVSLFIIMIN
jgi:hypothetical protein